ncbi:hypothetical protein ACWCPJ_31535 [Streptomyces collinus]
MADDLFSYAAQLGPQTPPASTHLPFVWRQDGGPIARARAASAPSG